MDEFSTAEIPSVEPLQGESPWEETLRVEREIAEIKREAILPRQQRLEELRDTLGRRRLQ